MRFHSSSPIRGLRSGALAVALTLLAPGAIEAQEAPDRAAILGTVERFFAAARARDSAGMGAVADPAGVSAAILYDRGRASVASETAAAGIARIAASARGPDLRLLATEVWQDGDVAMVWALYRSTTAGGSGCGYDALDLVRREGRWRIVAGGYTARPDGCDSLLARESAGEPLHPPSASDRAAVLAVVDEFFAALRARDTAALTRVVSSRAAWNTASYRGDRVVIGSRPASQDHAILTRATEPLVERLLDAVVRVDGDLAVVWGPYRFEVGERLSHCGHDGFRLIREDGRWRLEGGVYTIRPDGCPSLIGPRQVDSLPSRAPDTVIAYGSDARQFGELRLPSGRGPFPVAVVVHGGCWQRMFASAGNTAALADALRSAGVATWNVEYRTAEEPGGGWPGTFLDVADATDLLRTLARRYPIDTTRVVAVGHSAGGHLALWLAARGRLPVASPLARPAPLALAGAVALGPVMDLGEAAERIGGTCGRGATLVVGGTPAEVPERHAEAVPIELLPLGVPHTILVGELDGIMPAWPREAYVQKARRLGDVVELAVVPGAGHFEPIAPTSEAWAVVRERILRRLAGRGAR